MGNSQIARTKLLDSTKEDGNAKKMMEAIMTAEEYSRTTTLFMFHTGYNADLYMAALAHFNIYPTKYEFNKYAVQVSPEPLKTQCFRKKTKWYHKKKKNQYAKPAVHYVQPAAPQPVVQPVQQQVVYQPQPQVQQVRYIDQYGNPIQVIQQPPITQPRVVQMVQTQQSLGQPVQYVQQQQQPVPLQVQPQIQQQQLQQPIPPLITGWVMPKELKSLKDAKLKGKPKCQDAGLTVLDTMDQLFDLIDAVTDIFFGAASSCDALGTLVIVIGVISLIVNLIQLYGKCKRKKQRKKGEYSHGESESAINMLSCGMVATYLVEYGFGTILQSVMLGSDVDSDNVGVIFLGYFSYLTSMILGIIRGWNLMMAMRLIGVNCACDQKNPCCCYFWRGTVFTIAMVFIPIMSVLGFIGFFDPNC